RHADSKKCNASEAEAVGRVPSSSRHKSAAVSNQPPASSNFPTLSRQPAIHSQSATHSPVDTDSSSSVLRACAAVPYSPSSERAYALEMLPIFRSDSSHEVKRVELYKD